MSTSYNIDTDERFIRNYETSFVDRLDKKGFPISDEQEKNVHKTGRAYGQSLNYYVGQAKQLYKQGKLFTAEGVDLDNLGVQFRLPRLPDEADSLYRTRLQALFSPKKVTKPYIEAALNSFLTLNPPVNLFEPWRYVLRFDNVEPELYGNLDTGNSYLWSADYWRSGILVIKSGFSTELIGVVKQLVAVGIKVIFHQYNYGSIDPAGVHLQTLSWNWEKMQDDTYVADSLWFDLPNSQAFDQNYANLDFDDFFGGLVYRREQQHHITDFDLATSTHNHEQSYDQTGVDFYLNNNPGDWLKFIFVENISDTISISTSHSVVFAGEIDTDIGSSIIFSTVLSIVHYEALSDTIQFSTGLSGGKYYTHSNSSSFTISTSRTDELYESAYSGVNYSDVAYSGVGQ